MFLLVFMLVFLAAKDVMLNIDSEMTYNDIEFLKDDLPNALNCHSDGNKSLYIHQYEDNNKTSFNLTKNLIEYIVVSGESVESLKLGGYTVDISARPSLVQIFYKDNFECAGNIISERHVLTAAHCVTINYLTVEGKISWKPVHPAILLSFRIGSSYLGKDGEVNFATKINVHPEYLTNKDVTNYRDIAIVKLKDIVKFNVNAKPACIHPYLGDPLDQVMNFSTTCSIAGWGKTGIESLDKQLDRKLLKVEQNLIKVSECNEMYSDTDLKVDQNVQVCTFTEGKDACQGDSGGGLYCPDGLLAIISWGEGCANYPGVFARVDNSMDFIKSVLNKSSISSLNITLVLILFPKCLSLI